MRIWHEFCCLGPSRLLSAAFIGLVIACSGFPFSEAIAADVNYLQTRVTKASEDLLIGHGAFEISGLPHRWYSVYFDVRLDPNPVRNPTGEKKDKHLLKHWGDIFTPENIETARYADCRVGIPSTELANITNLPKEKRILLWVVCDIWDAEKKGFLGTGWGVRSPLIVKTDAAGNIIQTETFNTETMNPRKNHSSETIHVKKCNLALKHLKMKPGVKLYRAIGGKHEPYNILVKDERQTELGTLNRGFFFEPIDSAQKAAELVEIGYPGAVVIENRLQYNRIVQTVKSKGWQPGKHLKTEEPPGYGVSVRVEPELGYRVSALMIDRVNYYDLGLRSLIYREFAVSLDGRIGIEKEITHVLSPESETGARPGWTQPLPINPKPYNDLLRSVLTPDGSRVIPKVIVTGEKASIKCAEGEKSEWFLIDYKNWPKHGDE